MNAETVPQTVLFPDLFPKTICPCIYLDLHVGYIARGSEHYAKVVDSNVCVTGGRRTILAPS